MQQVVIRVDTREEFKEDLLEVDTKEATKVLEHKIQEESLNEKLFRRKH